ncbi:MAG TPA: hypothetical protein VGS22_26755 [Thermoanaerobaculia bacterium]|jgi:hypothetical protein|nr:hypothetical protein [Thermoanaerobaculia bacterium]
MTDRLRLLAVSLLLLCVALPAAARERRTNFRGAFDGKQMLRMTLIRDGDRITGVYLYEAVGEPMRVEGNAQGNEVRLSQVGEGGQRMGQFQGTWKGKVFSGNWTGSDSSARAVPFSFDADSSPDDGTSGTYEAFTGRLTNKLYVLLLPGQRLRFRLSAYWIPDGTDPSFANTGVVAGTMRMTGDTSVYEVEGCRLAFNFNGRNVRIEQSAPGPGCGMGQNVNGSGTYRQTDSEVDIAALEGF